MIGTDTIGVGGSSYWGEPNVRVVEPNNPHPEVKLMMLRRLDNFIGVMTQYQCLTEPFRHSYSMHIWCFDAVTVLCQYQLEESPDLLL